MLGFFSALVYLFAVHDGFIRYKSDRTCLIRAADAAWSVTSDSAKDQRDKKKGSALTVLHAILDMGGIVPDCAFFLFYFALTSALKHTVLEIHPLWCHKVHCPWSLSRSNSVGGGIKPPMQRQRRRRRRSHLRHQLGYICLCSACLCTGAEHIHGHGHGNNSNNVDATLLPYRCLFILSYFGDPKHNHLTEDKMHIQQPTSLSGDTWTVPKMLFQAGPGTVPGHGRAVFTLIKWTGLWGQVCSGSCLDD